MRVTRGARIRIAAAVVALGSTLATGAAGARSAAIEGAVRDATGLALPGVTVEARTAGGAEAGTAVTGGDGRFAIAGLPPGLYDVTFTLPGFRTVVRNGVAVGAGAVAALAVEMGVGLEDRVVVVGSRARPRSVTESAVPIDAIPFEDFAAQGDTDVGDQLRTLVPSYNVSPTPVGDAARLIRPATLRGLAPDHTLVLVNGKRRHRGAVITWIGNGVSDGAQGPDVSSIPSIALRQVEVLRDGAAAQYGSDAIAGVLNFLLKDDRSGGSLELHTGGHAAGDGGTWTVAGNTGLPLGENGFANLSLEYGETGATSRSVQRDDAAALVAAGNTHVRDPAQVWGSPRVDDNLKLWGNFGHLFAGGVQAWGYANYTRRTVESGFFFRNPNTRSAVFSADGGRSLLVGDVLDAADGVADGSAGCPAVPVTAARPDPAALARVFDDPGCFSFQERFPGGFTPQFGGDVDRRVGGGGRARRARGRPALGRERGRRVEHRRLPHPRHRQRLAGAGEPHRVRPRRLPAGRRRREPRPQLARERPGEPGRGAEWRNERFEIGLGDEASWRIGPYAAQGFSAGSNGFPGFSPIAAGTWSRANAAVYGDLEVRGPGDAWTLGSALRLEDFEDFGAATNGKLSGRVRLAPAAALRASASTGFRAPTPGQQNAFNVTTQYDHTLMDLVNNGTIPSTSRVARLRGGEPLEPERSVNFTAGAVVDAGTFSLTADYFRIRLSDRLALTQLFELAPAEVEALVAEGVTSAANLQNFRFFTNHFETVTQGLDLVASWAPPRLGGGTRFGLLFNRTATAVARFDPAVLDDTRIRQLQEAVPGTRWNATVRQAVGRWSVLGRVSWYDEWFDARDLYLYHGDAVVDLEASYPVGDSTTLTIGGRNAFGNDPEVNPIARQKGNRFSAHTPFGYNGAFYYLRLNYGWAAGG